MATTPKNTGATPANEETPSFSAPAAAPKKRSRYITPILALVAVLAVGVFGGVLIGQHTASSSSAQGGRTGNFPGGGTGTTEGGAAGGFGGGAGGNFTTGTVTTNDDGTLTVTTTAGDTVTVTTGDDTTVTTEGSVSDLTEGETVTVVGTADADGNVTATRISEGETTGFGGGGAPGGTQPTAMPTNN